MIFYFFADDAKIFVGIAKKINNIFLINSNKISFDPYLKENYCWTNQIFVDSSEHFSGCNDTLDFFHRSSSKILAQCHVSWIVISVNVHTGTDVPIGSILN